MSFVSLEPESKRLDREQFLEEIVQRLQFFDSVVVERGWGDAEALEQAYRQVYWAWAKLKQLEMG